VDTTNTRARAVHVLNRLTFGPRPGDVERVLDMGIDRWIDQQLRPESIVDVSGEAALAACPIWTQSVETSSGVVSRVTDGKMGGRVRAVVARGFGVRVISRDRRGEPGHSVKFFSRTASCSRVGSRASKPAISSCSRS
jgi:hypothetical protein